MEFYNIDKLALSFLNDDERTEMQTDGQTVDEVVDPYSEEMRKTAELNSRLFKQMSGAVIRAGHNRKILLDMIENPEFTENEIILFSCQIIQDMAGDGIYASQAQERMKKRNGQKGEKQNE